MNISKPRKPATALVVTYESQKTIEQALAAAHRCYDANLLDVIIVDNNSTDATREIIRREAAWAHIIVSGKNNGFGRGCNIGFEEATSVYTILINPDAIVEPEAVQTMVRFMDQHPKVGIVGPAIVEGDKGDATQLQITGHRPTPWTILRRVLPFWVDHPDSWPIRPGSEPARVGWVCGAVFMIRTELLKQLHGFDPRFFLYWEETDVCKRADDLGFETWALGTALAHHVGGASSSPDDTRVGGCIARHYFQSRYYYMVKHHGRVYATVAELGEFLLLSVGALIDIARGNRPHRLRPRLQAPLLSEPEIRRNEF